MALIVILYIIYNRLGLTLFLLHFSTKGLATLCLFTLTTGCLFLIGCLIVECARRLINGFNNILLEWFPLLIDLIESIGSRINLCGIAGSSIEHLFLLCQLTGIVPYSTSIRLHTETYL